MMKFLKLFGVCLMCLIFQGCPGDDFEPDVRINYVNNSDFDIVRLPLRFLDQLPVETPFENQEFIDARVISANTTTILDAESTNFKKNGLIFTFLSREVVETTPWEEIRENNMVLKTFDLTLEELEALDYTIEYP